MQTFVEGVRTVNGSPATSALQWLKAPPWSDTAEAVSRIDSVFPTPLVKTSPPSKPTPGSVPLSRSVPEQVVPEYVAHSSVNVTRSVFERILMLPSVKEVMAMPDSAPVAITTYSATNHSGRLN